MEKIKKNFMQSEKNMDLVVGQVLNAVYESAAKSYSKSSNKVKCKEVINFGGLEKHKYILEDLAFRFLQPDVYNSIARQLSASRAERDLLIFQSINYLETELKNSGIVAEIFGRTKHVFSIWRKMQRKGVSSQKIYDVLAIRVIVEDLESCYAALKIAHNLWKPIPEEFDDYIAAPKRNGYQSLHTAVIGINSQILEIQIRSRAMHQHSEFGKAAHWYYKNQIIMSYQTK